MTARDILDKMNSTKRTDGETRMNKIARMARLRRLIRGYYPRMTRMGSMDSLTRLNRMIRLYSSITIPSLTWRTSLARLYRLTILSRLAS